MKAEFNAENQLVLTPQSQAERIALEMVMRDRDRVIVAKVDNAKESIDSLLRNEQQWQRDAAVPRPYWSPQIMYGDNNPTLAGIKAD